jgi:phosphoribosylformimino-5-aminoimidazole carboxamide ribotide isomerase
MIVIPAIDIRAGRVVRLKGGVLQDETVYGHDPVAAARAWEAEGARRLHVVDLDAAIEGKPQPDALGAVIDAVKIPVEVGGGLRVLENAMRYKERGADRVIFGTAAVARPGVVQEAVHLWPEAVVVALDARNGRVTVAGWQELTSTTALDLAAQVKAWGVKRVQYTDVVRDGALSWPNIEATAELARQSGLRITAGGGVATLDDLRRLSVLEPIGIDEVIVGKALYEKRFTLAEAMEAVGQEPEDDA